MNRWDLFASDSSYARPTLLYITGGSDIEVSNLRQKNPPNVFNSVKGGSATVVFSDLTMDATSKSTNAAKNTDGFDIGESTDVTIKSVTVSNDDDCVAFKPGADGVTVTDITCTGSHGLSVGSLGKSSDDTVKNVYVSGATMINSTKAVGIKTYPSGGSHGLSTVTNVTYTDVTVDGCGYAIQIQSCYGEDTEYCEDNPGDAVLTDIVFKGFSGTTSGDYDDVTSNLDCGADGTCGITITDYTVVAPDGNDEVLCANTPSDLGVTCTSGASG
jgi:galacturan 1,4-alpha-galacturonidase